MVIVEFISHLFTDLIDLELQRLALLPYKVVTLTQAVYPVPV